VRSPTGERARRAESALSRQTVSGLRRAGALLALVVDAPSPAEAARLLDHVTGHEGGPR
jgi:hypothetical protein